MAIRSICRQFVRHVSGLLRVCRPPRVLRVSSAFAALYTAALLICGPFAAAAGPAEPVIQAVSFTGPNVDLAVDISGTGFGAAPDGVPCSNCTTPYLDISDGRGYGCQIFNIKSWNDSRIVFDGFQGNPGDYVLLLVTNPQTHLVGVSDKPTIPKTIELAPPKITSVTFAGSIGPDLEMTVVGSGFGAAPPAVPFNGDLAFFSFVDRPFAANQWQAGYSLDTTTLKYGFWSDNRIVVVGFGGSYGAKTVKVRLDDPVEIAVAKSAACGLNVNAVNAALGPTSIGAVWGGLLR